MDEDNNDPVRDIMPPEWDMSAYDWMRRFKALASEMSEIEITGSGGGDGFADFSFKCGNHSFWVDFKKQVTKN